MLVTQILEIFHELKHNTERFSTMANLSETSDDCSDIDLGQSRKKRRTEDEKRKITIVEFKFRDDEKDRAEFIFTLAKELDMKLRSLDVKIPKTRRYGDHNACVAFEGHFEASHWQRLHLIESVTRGVTVLGVILRKED